MRPMLLLLLLLPALCPRAAAQVALTFAECDSSEPRQQWCLSANGQLKDHWGRCVSRHDCTTLGAVGVGVFVDTCGALCAGSQHWKMDEGTGQIAAQIHSACPSALAKATKPLFGDLCQCLDISVKNNVAQTYPCKNGDKGGAETGYCGVGNQLWTINSDGTMSVPTQPSKMCPKIMDPGCKNPCGKVCLVTAPPEPGAIPDTVDTGGRCIDVEGDLGENFVAVLLLGAGVYLCGGVAWNKRKDSRRPWREALPHKPFWRSTPPLPPCPLPHPSGSPTPPLLCPPRLNVECCCRARRHAGACAGRHPLLHRRPCQPLPPPPQRRRALAQRQGRAPAPTRRAAKKRRGRGGGGLGAETGEGGAAEGRGRR